jgi:threonine aldolase
MNHLIDLRSDTVTRPSKEMLNAMLAAPVGDDVFGEDPTVNLLEEESADMFGMEAGLFCPSGTMTNQIAIRVHTRPGDEVICDAASHILNYEGGGIAANSQAQPRVIQGDRGRLSASQVIQAINPDHDWLARTALVSLENTVNRAGGSYYTLDRIDEIREVCQSNKLPLHLDGARIFNALTATGEKAGEFGKRFDSISVCLSKGLGAPVGSVLLGSKAFIKEARRIRKRMGGGMRQAGLLAEAGRFSLRNNIIKLAEDHQKAALLYETLKDKPWVSHIFPADTNIVLFELSNQINGAVFSGFLRDSGIIVSSFSGQTIRMVTHLDVSMAEIHKVVEVLHHVKP